MLFEVNTLGSKVALKTTAKASAKMSSRPVVAPKALLSSPLPLTLSTRLTRENAGKRNAERGGAMVPRFGTCWHLFFLFRLNNVARLFQNASATQLAAPNRSVGKCGESLVFGGN